MIGTTLGHYRIVEKIGEGGMGEVFRANDERLDRDVAIKVLPEAVAGDADRLARFEREAKLLASLSHQNIAALYGLEELEGRRFLVMELADGETLAERLKKGPIPVDDALPIALQIAEGLEAAHEHGIIHRDLKPANVMLSAEGQVKILDFGLAKVWQPEQSDADLTHSPTLTAQGTAAGVLLGTAAYMSPEQARGKSADKRADIWAFGVMLFEMLTGVRMFEGETTSDVLAAVLRAETDWSQLPPETPRPVVRLLRRCLDRDPRERLHDIADARLEIEEGIARPSWASPDRENRQTPAFREGLKAAWPAVVVAAFVAATLAGGAVWKISGVRPAASRVSMRLTLRLPQGVAFDQILSYYPSLAISPDGRWLVFAAVEGETYRLFKRSLEQFDAVAMPGTEDGFQPFFSPDGRWVGFFADDGFLKKVPLAGGPPQNLCRVEHPNGAAWGPDETIVFNMSELEGLWRVPATGGEPEQIASRQVEQGDSFMFWPAFLPDGGAVLFTRFAGSTAGSARIELLDLESHERKTLVENASYARYVPTGHLIFSRAGRVEVAPFDASRREVTGPSIPVHETILYESEMGLPQLAASTGGTLAFVPGSGAPRLQLVSVALDGTERPLVESRRRYMYPRFSPDGERLAVTVSDPGDTNVWVVDLRTGAQTKLTHEGVNTLPVWTPDGDRVTYVCDRGDGTFSIDWMRADGSGQGESLVSSRQPGEWVFPGSWSPDGEWLVYHKAPVSDIWGDIWIAARDGDPEPRPLVATRGVIDMGPAISPDGRWLAFASDDSGQFEVYVQSFPDGGERHQISTDGGFKPVWSPDGRRVFYKGSQILAVSISTTPQFEAGIPQVLLEGQYEIGTFVTSPNFDVAPDGKSFVFVKGDEEWGRATEIRVVLNWTEELKRLAPTE